MPHASSGWTRRETLKWGATALAAGTLPAIGQPAAPAASSPRKVIFLVSDGMSAGVPSLAEPFSLLVRNTGTHWHRLMSQGTAAQGLFDMASLNSLVTDSAAAASSWGSGQRVFNSALNTYPDGVKLTPLCRVLAEKGIRTALVTTARITHATPAGFDAVVSHRDKEDEIAVQYLESGPDVLLGGGSRHFSDKDRKDKRDVRGEFAAKGAAVLATKADLAAWNGSGRVLGLFASDHVPYTVDQRAEPDLQKTIPTLAEMTAAALKSLASTPDFFLMVEGARIDHAAHANDAAGVLWDQLAFDDAVGVALAFQKEHPDALVIISSDHGNANPGLNGMGSVYKDSTGCFRRLAKTTRSFSWIRRQLDGLKKEDKLDEAAVGRIISESTGLAPSKEECAALKEWVSQRKVHEWSTQHANFYGTLGQILGNWCGIGWTGVTHTADWTQLTAVGPGQDAFQGLVRNTTFFDRICDFWKISYRNPAYTGTLPDFSAPDHATADPTG
jgi:alkaline phosphatase